MPAVATARCSILKAPDWSGNHQPPPRQKDLLSWPPAISRRWLLILEYCRFIRVRDGLPLLLSHQEFIEAGLERLKGLATDQNLRHPHEVSVLANGSN